jgi:hypothetical protein
VAAIAGVVFVVLTFVVTSNPSRAVDARAFKVADGLRAPWLDTVAKLVTSLGLIAIVGSSVLIGAVLLRRST